MSSVSPDLLKSIQTDNLMQVTFNENTLKNNFETIIKILSALKNEVGAQSTKILNVENQCSQINAQVSGIKDDVDQIKDNEKEIIKNLQNQQDKTEKNTSDISEIQKKLQKHGETLNQHQYEIDSLKEKLKNVDFDELKEIQKNFPSLQKEVNHFNQMSKEFSEEIQNIKEKLEQLNSKQDYLQVILNNLNDKNNNNSNNGNSQNNLGKQSSLSDRQNEGANSKTNRNGNSQSNFNDGNNNFSNEMIDKILQDIAKMKSQFVTKEELKKDQDKQSKELMDEINKIVQKLQKQIDDRVKCDDFDKLYLFLQSRLNDGKQIKTEELNELNQVSGGLSTKDKNLLNNLQEKMEDLEGFLNALREELHNHIENYDLNKQTTDGRLDELEKNMLQTAKQEDLKRLRSEVKSIREGLDKNVDKANQLEVLINELRRQLNKLRSLVASQNGGDIDANLLSPTNALDGYGKDGINQNSDQNNNNNQNMNKKDSQSRKSSKLNSLHEGNNNNRDNNNNNNRNNDLNNNNNSNNNAGDRNIHINGGDGSNSNTHNQNNNNNNVDWGQAIDEVRNELLILINQLKDLIDRKADKEDLYGLEQMLLGKLDEVAGAVLNKLKTSASGPETAKKFSELEKKITNIYNIFFSKEEGDDGLIVKRPLNKWSCISCDKSLNQYKGKLGNYHNWAIFPPKETSPEKMGRYGQSYAKNSDKKMINTSSSKKALSNNRIPSESKLPNLPSSQRDDYIDGKNLFYKTSGNSNPNLFTPKQDGNNSYQN
ncbi:hypothetical protein ABPG72_013161 [Tetrahymena utriculariae]